VMSVTVRILFMAVVLVAEVSFSAIFFTRGAWAAFAARGFDVVVGFGYEVFALSQTNLFIVVGWFGC
jgi:uncharacterized membrane protein